MNINGVNRNYFARLNSNGSLDTSFNPDLGNGYPDAIALESDGKILISGYRAINNVLRYFVARIYPDGNQDVSFDAGAGPNSFVSSLTVQPDGKTIVGGWFTNFNGITRSHIARLNSNGSLDTSFDPGIGPNDRVGPVVLQRNGKMLVGGAFTSISGVARGGIARLNPDGGLDASFNPSSGADTEVDAIALQSRNRILIGGIFSSVNGVARGKIARLFAGGALIPRIKISPQAEFAGVTNVFVISPNNTNALVVLDGSQSSGAENDPLQYSWVEGTNIFATGVRVTNIFKLGVHTVSLIVDDGTSTATGTVAFEVIKPSKAVGLLIALLQNSHLPRRMQRQLVARLELASALFERGHFRVGIHLLRAFQHGVRVQVSPQAPVLAANLIDGAQEIINALAATAANTTSGGHHGRINLLARQPNGHTRLQFSVAPGHDYVIEASTNLLDWEVIGIYEGNGKDSFDFEDVEANQFPARFYRMVAP